MIESLLDVCWGGELELAVLLIGYQVDPQVPHPLRGEQVPVLVPGVHWTRVRVSSTLQHKPKNINFNQMVNKST